MTDVQRRTPHQCRHAGKHSPRLLRSHLDDCAGPPCPGCQPCPERHCQVCDEAHVTVDGHGNDETCASCLGETRSTMKSIVTMCARMLGEAIMRGINSEAAMLAGPAADPETWGYRRMSALAGRIDDAFLEDCRDELHPLWVLGTWEQLARDHLAQPSEEPVTVTEAQRYLDQHLTRLAHDPAFAFDELARDIGKCHAHLEDVLAEGERDIHGAPCLTCKRPLLRDDQDTEESWWCERCKRRSNADQYRLAVATAYRAHAKRLPVTDLAERIGVPAGTIRRWASIRREEIPAKIVGGVEIEPMRIVEHPPLLHSAGVDSQQRKVYDVGAAERLRDRNTTNEVA